MPVRLEASAGLSELEEKSSTPSYAWQINGDVLNFICLVGAKTKTPRESAGCEWMPKGSAQFRLLMPSRARGTSSQVQHGCGTESVLRCTAVLQTTCARQEVWGWPNPRVKHGELAQQRLEEMGDHTSGAGTEEGLSSPVHQLSGLKSCVSWTSHVKGWCFQPHSLVQWGSQGYHTWPEAWPVTPDLPKSCFYLFSSWLIPVQAPAQIKPGLSSYSCSLF